ncbi:MAG: hypothetical protein JWQ90_5153 [Hydrocarboniphaga sp.]|uniref:hypothetical protein n=1 Tax=Hydrocarboniphaga sp. TaxID=2033016 RepID=UPI00261A3B8E|nr:hypothetical protein [Hydrocarboniphaga sp.]MDB5972703.1 hypothetical protein [Hydrocarboniphaga sp.]
MRPLPFCCAAALLLGCAAAPPVPDKAPDTRAPQLSIGGVIADRDAPSSNWIDSRVSVAGPLDLVNYQAGYAIQGGDLLPRLADHPQTAPLLAAPSQIGGGAFTQSVATALPSVAGGKPSLSFNTVDSSTLTSAGDTQRREQHQAQLAWTTSPLSLQLQWAATQRSVADPATPLDCSLGGKVQLGLGVLGAADQSLQFGARSCSVNAPDRVAGGLGVDSWSGAWQFGPADRSGRLRFTMLETLPSTMQQSTGPAASGYELQLSQTRSAGPWTGDTAVGVRRVTEIDGAEAGQWVAQANLRREIANVAVTAGWQRDADPLWYVPGAASPVDQVAVGLDLRSWLQQRLGLSNLVNANLSYRWNESADPNLSGGAVYWNLAKSW